MERRTFIKTLCTGSLAVSTPTYHTSSFFVSSPYIWRQHERLNRRTLLFEWTLGRGQLGITRKTNL